MRSTLALITCLVCGAAAVRLRTGEVATKVNVTANATAIWARDVNAVFKIVAFKMTGCKKINPGTPLPTGKFNWDIEDFNPESLKMSPCGQDGESGIFDSAADEEGEGGLMIAMDAVFKVLKPLLFKLIQKKADGTIDDDATLAQLDKSADKKVSHSEWTKWMSTQAVAGVQDEDIQAKIFDDLLDTDKDGDISADELKASLAQLDKDLLQPKSQTALVAQKAIKVNGTANASAIWARDVNAVFKIVAFQMTGCKKINPGTPLPTGKFNWDIEDFNPESLKMSPCGQDGESGIFDSAADEEGEGGLMIAMDAVFKVLKPLLFKLIKKKADGTIDDDATLAQLDTSADKKVSHSEWTKWMSTQAVAGVQDEDIQGKIFDDLLDTDKDGDISADELKASLAQLDKDLLQPKSQTALVAQKGIKVNGTANATTIRTRDVKAVFKILAFQMTGCKKINPGTPLPEGKFNWDIEDFNPESLKMSPCGQDGESGIFDSAAEQTGENGLAVNGEAVMKILKPVVLDFNTPKADGTVDHAAEMAVVDTSADKKISFAEFEAWMLKQRMAGAQDPLMHDEIFGMFDTDKDDSVSEDEFKTVAAKLNTELFPVKKAFLQNK